MTVRSDKKTGNITIKDMESSSSKEPEVLKVIKPPQVVIKEADYNSQNIRKIVETVNTTKISVEKIHKIVA